MAEVVVDSVKYPSLPSNYITLQWLKDKQTEKLGEEEENEKKEQHPFPQNHNGKGVDGTRGKANSNKKKKKKRGYFVKGEGRVGRDMGKEGMMREVEEERNVDRGRCGVGFKGKKNRWRKRVDVKDTADDKVRMGGGSYCEYGDKEVASAACMVVEEVVGESKQSCGVGFRGKKNSRRGMGSGVGEVSEKGDSLSCAESSLLMQRPCRILQKYTSFGKSEMHPLTFLKSPSNISVEQLGQERNAKKEKVKVRGAYSDKEVEQVDTACAVEVVGENKLGKECRVGFRGKKNCGRRMGDGVGRGIDKADKAKEGVEQPGHVYNTEKEEVSVDVKERTNEKVRVRGAIRAHGDKSIDVHLTDSEAKIESDLGDLSLSDRRYGHGRSSVVVYDNKFRYGNSTRYDNKWRYRNSRRYEPRKMLKQKDSSFMWIKKETSSNANAAEIEAQVDFSSQSTSQSKLCSQ